MNQASRRCGRILSRCGGHRNCGAKRRPPTGDPRNRNFNLEQARFDLDQSEQTIAKAQVKNAVEAEDALALAHARLEVRRAELNASGNELISAVEAKKNLLLLDEPKQQIAQLEQDVQRHRESTGAAAAVCARSETKPDRPGVRRLSGNEGAPTRSSGSPSLRVG
jgi:hypothetical protein